MLPSDASNPLQRNAAEGLKLHRSLSRPGLQGSEDAGNEFSDGAHGRTLPAWHAPISRPPVIAAELAFPP